LRRRLSRCFKNSFARDAQTGGRDAHPTRDSPQLLLVNRFELLMDDFAGNTVDRHMQPVALFSFGDETSQES
jgi:hypothetical protein